MKPIKNLLVLTIGVAVGAFCTFSYQALADKKGELPLVEIRQFSSVFNAIKQFYVDDVSDGELLENAMSGMVSGLDPHSAYLDEKDFKDLSETTQGAFGGLGLEVTKDPSGVLVSAPIDDTPAAKAGIRPGDIITRINDRVTMDLSLNAAVKLMRGKPKTKITLQIARKGEDKPLIFKLERAIINVKSVKFKSLDHHIAYVRISQFQEKTTQELVDALSSITKDKQLKGIVLDLRNNPGGVLQAAVGVSATFLPEKLPVVSIKGRNEDSEEVFFAQLSDYDFTVTKKDSIARLSPLVKELPLVVLLNSSSASASEIVAGALQDHKRATIMGDRSFGKGSVQTILPLRFKDKTAGLKITTARYYTPSGRSIQARGIVPNIYIDDTPNGNYPSFQIREADLNRHLKNQEGDINQEQDQGKASASKYHYLFGDKKDYPLQQAVLFLQGKAVKKSQVRGKRSLEK